MFLKIQKFFIMDGKKIVYGFRNGTSPLSKKVDMKTDSSDQRPDIFDTFKQTEFNDFLKQIKEEQKNIEIKLFKKYFPYKTPNKKVQVLNNSKRKVIIMV